MIKLLFVCTGNICRSPTAEGVFRHKAHALGLADRFHAQSAGVASYHVGEPPDPRSVAAAAARGYDLRDIRARRVRPADFDDFDLILAMDSGHHRALKTMAPRDQGDKISLFLSHAASVRQRDVPDPYYGAGNHFEEVLDLIEAGADGLLDEMCRTRLAKD